jgi:hypothetical protein
MTFGSSRTKRPADKPARCTKCKVVKQPHEYHKTRYGTLNSWCRACTNNRSLEYYNTYFKKEQA